MNEQDILIENFIELYNIVMSNVLYYSLGSPYIVLNCVNKCLQSNSRKPPFSNEKQDNLHEFLMELIDSLLDVTHSKRMNDYFIFKIQKTPISCCHESLQVKNKAQIDTFSSFLLDITQKGTIEDSMKEYFKDEEINDYKC